jgi:uncharacterized membrane protein HdeD (DUF308 family)
MKEKQTVTRQVKLNIFALVSILFIPLFAVGILGILLNRMYQFIPLRDLDLTSIFMALVLAFACGLGMLITGILAVVRRKRVKQAYKGTWLAVIGIILGSIMVAIPLFFMVDYLLQI